MFGRRTRSHRREILSSPRRVGTCRDGGAAVGRLHDDEPRQLAHRGNALRRRPLLAQTAPRQVAVRRRRRRRRRRARSRLDHPSPGSFTDDERAASFDPPRAACCVPAPPVIEFDAGRQRACSAGAGRPPATTGRSASTASTSTAQGNVWIAGNDDQDHQILKFTARRQVPDADRQGRARPAAATTPRSSAGRRTCGRRRGQRALRRRRLRQPPRHRLRCDDRRLQAPLGRLRQAGPTTPSTAPTTRRRRPPTAVRQSRALRRLAQRRAALRLRPRERPHPGVPQGRRVRARVLPRQGDDADRLGVGPGAL